MKREPASDRKKYLYAKHELAHCKARLRNAEEKIQSALQQAESMEMLRKGLACNPEPLSQNLAKLLDAEVHNLRKGLGR